MDSDDEQEEPTVTYQGSSGCIVLINCFESSSNNTAAVAYEATCEMVRKSMIHSNSRLIGICLYGTKDTNTTGTVVENVVQILPLATPSVDNLKKMLSINVANYGQASDLNLSDVLWHCSKMFKQCSKRLSTRTILLMTRLDLPPSNLDSTKRHQTLKRVVDLTNLGIDLKLINISEKAYKEHPFYKEMLVALNKGNDDAVPRPVWKSEEIQKLMQQHTHRHLATARINFTIGDDLSIGVGVYKIVQQCAMPKTIKMSNSTNEILTTTNKTMKVTVESDDQNKAAGVADSSQNVISKETPLLKSELLHYQNYGGERIEFTDNEFQKIKNPFDPRVMKLLGFKPFDMLCKEKWFCKSCDFLFPSESIVEGSTKVFKALHQACTETSMLPMCVLCTRANSQPKYVALSPCTRPLGLNIDIGFDIIYIPYLENLKDIPNFEHNSANIVDEAHLNFMKDILQVLKFDFKPDTFENPKLQSLYRAMEALALDIEEPKTFIDTTNPEQSLFQNIDAEKFEQLFGPFIVENKQKRSVTSKSDGPPSKRKQTTEIDEELFESRIGMKQINKYTVEELKRLLAWKKPPNLPAITGLKKNDLVNLVYEHLGNI